MNRQVFIGWDPREAAAFAVARHSMLRHTTRPIEVSGLSLDFLTDQGLYKRPMERDGRGRLIDVLSRRDDYDGAISTEHANARFFAPFLAAKGADWVLFTDGDILLREDVHELFDSLDPAFAVYCVKHDYAPADTVKMDGQAQTRYGRKNWSSVFAYNAKHPANDSLTLEMVNTLPGRDLHAFCWLDEYSIGALDPAWNWLAGHSDTRIDPKLIHYTSGVPDMAGYENTPFADEWREERSLWVRGEFGVV